MVILVLMDLSEDDLFLIRLIESLQNLPEIVVHQFFLLLPIMIILELRLAVLE